MVSVAVLEDNSVLLKSFIQIIKEFDFVEHVDGFETNKQFCDALNRVNYDVVLADISLEDGVSYKSMLQFKEINPSGSLIVISSSLSGADALRSIKSGAVGYINKNDSSIGIGSAIQLVLNGQSPISPSIAFQICSELHIKRRSHVNESVSHSKSILTKRETEILNILSRGLSNLEVAILLGISENTIPVHIRNIYKKLNTKNRLEAVFEARSLGILES